MNPLSQRAATIAAILLLFGLAGCSGSGKQAGSDLSGPATKPIGEEFRLTIVPYEAAAKLSKAYQPMADYLAKRMGAPKGKYFPVSDYSGVLAALETGDVDVAYLSPFPYALATSQMKLHGLAMPWVKGTLTYTGVLFVRKESPIKTLADLKGRTVAFGDTTSTSGYLMPRALLEKEGVFGQLKSWRNAGNATIVAAAVENGLADCGAAYELVFEVAYKDEPAKQKMFRVIAHTDPMPNGIYVARGDLPLDQVEKLRKVFLEMNTDLEGKQILEAAPNDKVVPADDKLFDPVRSVAKVLKLNLTDLEKK